MTKGATGALEAAATDRADRSDVTAAVLLMCGAVALFACSDATTKWLARSVDPLMIAWWRYAVNVAVVTVVLNPAGRPAILRSQRPGLQALRSTFLLLTTVLNFFALRHLQLTQSISIQFGMPLLVALLAGPLLGEWAGPRRLAAIAVGFCGVLVVVRPGVGSMHPAAFLSLAGTVFYALYALATRTLARHDRAETTVFYSGTVGLVLTTPILPFVWTAPAEVFGWGLLVAVGLFSAVGHWLLVLAHGRASAPFLAPLLYTQLLWMTVLGFVLFGDVPDRWTVVGAGIVVASGLYLLHRERRQRPIAR